LDTIYYLGIIDILTPYGWVKKVEHLWKGMKADRVCAPFFFLVVFLGDDSFSSIYFLACFSIRLALFLLRSTLIGFSIL
jgi:hypothetical protein